MKAKHSSANLYRAKKKYKKRRSSMEVQKEKLLTAMFNFFGVSLGILLLPFGLLDWGRKCAKARKVSARGSERKKAASKSKDAGTASQATKNKTQPLRTEKAPSAYTNIKTMASTNTTASTNAALQSLFEYPESRASVPEAKAQALTESDENTPKSTPKNEKDQYIRKRMIIAGSRYCDKAALDTLEPGAYIDLEAEPDNPYDKDAVKLLFNGQKIGYIAKKDRMAFAACLKLNRKVYGIITAITEADGQPQYEYETWFDCAGK
jgi:hypothetical protein